MNDLPVETGPLNPYAKAFFWLYSLPFFVLIVFALVSGRAG
ncbi:hypothetical protein [Nibrella viscosa]